MTEYILAEGFYPEGEDGIHDSWRKQLLATVASDKIVFTDNMTGADPIVLEDVFSGKRNAKLMDAWMDPDKRERARQVCIV